MHIRPYDPTKDKQAVYRIFREVGWAEPGKEPLFDLTLECGRALVAELEGASECIVTTAPGDMRYLDDELPMVEVTAVATSRVARQQGCARRTLAQALAADAAEGAALARVCVFDQGFYNQVGFGPGSYEHTFWFDPATLRVEVRPRVPRRLTADDAKLIHASRLSRRRGHGSAVYPAVELTEMEMRWWSEKGFGLGYCDGVNGELTHHFWCSTGDSEHGPYSIAWVTFQTRDQFLELMALLRGLSDQVHLVRLREPAGVQLQDLLHRPFRHHGITERSRYENRSNVYAFWQVRLLDLGKALAHTHLPWGEVHFSLHLSDPIAQYLPEDAAWRGIGGDFTITLGPSSSATRGTTGTLPTLTATVNSFSRLWLGVGPATGLAMTDQLSGPEHLLAELDEVLRLPQPRPDWDF